MALFPRLSLPPMPWEKPAPLFADYDPDATSLHSEDLSNSIEMDDLEEWLSGRARQPASSAIDPAAWAREAGSSIRKAMQTTEEALIWSASTAAGMINQAANQVVSVVQKSMAPPPLPPRPARLNTRPLPENTKLIREQPGEVLAMAPHIRYGLGLTKHAVEQRPAEPAKVVKTVSL